jgi:hypothetical protein
MNDQAVFLILVFVALELVVLSSMTFWFYWPATLYLTNHYRTSRCTPGALLVVSVAIQLLFCVAIFCITANTLVGLVVPLSGLIGWIVLGVKRHRAKAAVRAFRNECPLPRMQCSMLDIYTGVLYFALAMTVCTACIQAVAGETLEAAVFPTAAYFLVVTYLGFYASLDVLRRAPKPLSRKSRFWTIVGVMLAFSFSFIVGGLIAWRAWQKALQTVGMEDWQKAQIAAQKSAAASVVANPRSTD